MASSGRHRTTGSLGLFLARSLHQTGLLATIGVIVCVLTGLLAGLLGFLTLSRTTSARAALASAAPTESGYRFEVEASNDPAGQADIADRVFARELARIPAEVTTVFRSDPIAASLDGVAIADQRGTPAQLVVASGEDLVDHARLVSGQWPAASGDGQKDGAQPDDAQAGARQTIDAAIHDGAAAALGLSVGDVVDVAGDEVTASEDGPAGGETLSIRIVGTWLPQDGTDPFWFSDVQLLTGVGYPTADGARLFGPLVIAGPPQDTLPTEAQLGARQDALHGTLQWTILPDPDRIAAGNLAGAVAAAGAIQRSLDDELSSSGRVRVSGDLDDTATRFSRAQNAIRGVTPVGFILVALIGTITLAQVSRLLVVARRPDSALLLSRGSSRARLVGHACVEAIIVCALGSAAGVWLAGLFVTGLTGLYGPPGVVAGGLALSLLAVGLAVLSWVVSAFVVIATCVADAIRSTPSGIADHSRASGLTEGRARTVVTLGSMVLALAAATLTIGQLLVYGSPIVTDAAGRESVDPLAVLAPALGLIAAALVLLALAKPLARWVERLIARTRMLQPSLSTRQLARGLSRYSAAILVIALAVGALVIASTYSGSRSLLDASSGQLRVGADERLVFSEGGPGSAGLTPLLAGRYRALAGVTDAAPAVVSNVTLPDDVDGVLTAIDAAQLPRIMADVQGSVDTTALSNALLATLPPDDASLASALPTGTPFGIEVPEGTRTVTMLGTLDALAPNRDGPVARIASVTGAVWFESADGSLLNSPFGPIFLDSGEHSGLEAQTTLPEDGSGWRIVAVDIRAQASQYWTVDLNVTGFEGTAADGAARGIAFTGTDWTSQLPLGDGFGLDPAASFAADAGTFTIDLSLRYGDRSGARAMAVSDAAPLARASSYAGTVDPLPVAISRTLADELFLEPGDPLELQLKGSTDTVTAVVATVIRHVPGTPSRPALLADLPSLSEHILRTSEFVPTANELWLGTEDGPVDVSSLAGPGTRVSTPTSSAVAAITAPAEISLWFAAAGSILFAALSLGAVALTVTRMRRTDVLVLRAGGIPASVQARTRFGETSVVSTVAIAFGLAGGILIAALTVPALARSVVLDVPPDLATTVVPVLLPGLALLAALAVALTVIAAADAVKVRRQASNPDLRWEAQ